MHSTFVFLSSKHFLKLAVISLVAMLSVGSAQSDQTLTLMQDLPIVTHIELGAEGSTHGDIRAFEAVFRDGNGASGVISGMLVTVEIPIGENGLFIDRISQIVIDFGGVDTIVIAGKSVYPYGADEMTIDLPQVRAVVGGTGHYIGARGQMLTTRRGQGHYEHNITLID